MKLEALIAYLADRVEIKGKKALQKLVYFCSEAGVPVYTSFRMHIYGPHSNEVFGELGEAILKETVKALPNGRFSKGVACDECIARHKGDIEANRKKIDAVLGKFADFSPLMLELYATVHFIATALYEAYGEVQEEQVVAEVCRAKGDKFSVLQTKRAYQDLVEWDWLKVAH